MAVVGVRRQTIAGFNQHSHADVSKISGNKIHMVRLIGTMMFEGGRIASALFPRYSAST